MSNECMRQGTRAVAIQCPYCGNLNKRYLGLSDTRPIVMLCDVNDSPGCDRYFVAQMSWRPAVRTYAIDETVKPIAAD